VTATAERGDAPLGIFVPVFLKALSGVLGLDAGEK